MDNYILRFKDDRASKKPVKIRAEDLSDAYMLARNEAFGRAADLWRGTRHICSFQTA